MSIAEPTRMPGQHTYAERLPELSAPAAPSTAPSPALVILNESLATELGLSIQSLRSDEGVHWLVGARVDEACPAVAQAYAGHQFGGYSPRLGDGRAMLLGEVIDVLGQRRDIHCKGSGRTVFSRGGDGKAALGPMLREYLMGEAMHALAVPTTRALAVCTTGETIARDTMLPGAVLARVASSHLRVGTFQYAASLDDPSVLERLVAYAIERHYPDAADSACPPLALFERVLERQTQLVAHWMSVGFVHGVMNTDNMTISGETIDYGPCAFIDAYSPQAVFSSIDHQGRYAFANQPGIAQWNLARLAETLLPLIDDDIDVAVAKATELLGQYPERHDRHYGAYMAARLGLGDGSSASPIEDRALIDDFLAILQTNAVDYTSAFRSLATMVDHSSMSTWPTEVWATVADPTVLDAWWARWQLRLHETGRSDAEIIESLNATNPMYIARNHLVEAALDAATNGDLDPVRALLDAVGDPFTDRAHLAGYAAPAPASFGRYRTYCGT